MTALVVAAHCATPFASRGAKQVLDVQAVPSLQAFPASLNFWLHVGFPPLVNCLHSPPPAVHFASAVIAGGLTSVDEVVVGAVIHELRDMTIASSNGVPI